MSSDRKPKRKVPEKEIKWVAEEPPVKAAEGAGSWYTALEG